MEFFDRLRSAGESKAGHVKASPTVSHKSEAGHAKTILGYDQYVPCKSVGGYVGS